MVIAWFGYCLLTSALLGAAAFATERALGHYRKPVRGVWVAALAGSLLLPIAAWGVPALVARVSPVPQGVPIPIGALSALAAGGAGASASGIDWGAVAASAGTLLAWLWAVSALALGGYFVASYRGLRREMADWAPGKVLDAPVMMARNRGPAVVGIRRAVIVMPTWIADLHESLLRLVFLHELEHQRAGDQRWFAFGLLAAIAMPWNPMVWWQLHRLRLAIEYDCDRRVLDRGVSRRDYAEALLAVGERVTAAPFAAAAFTERTPAVERRLRRMTEPLRRLRGARAAVAAGAGALALVLACGSPTPTSPDAEAGHAVAEIAEKVPAGTVSPADRPAFRPYDRPPTLANREAVVDALAEAYPAELRDAGIGGRVELWLHIDERGEVVGHEVKTTSGQPRFDEAAIEVGRRMRFSPALNRDQPTDVWVSQWITFQDPASARQPLREGAAGVIEKRRTPGAAIALSEEERPLIVVDGVIEDESYRLDDVDKVSIDRIEVIKGEAATALYGERGRHGAIHITTKEAAGSTGDGATGAIYRYDRDGGPAEIRERTRVRTLAPYDLPGADEGVRAVEGGSWSAIPVGERPLLVIDGVIQADFSSLKALEENRDDIDRVDMIKGPLAERLYGDRGRNGVIDVRTKSGSPSGG